MHRSNGKFLAQAGLVGLSVALAAVSASAVAGEAETVQPSNSVGTQGMRVTVDPTTGAIQPGAPASLQFTPQEQNAFSTSSEGLLETPLPGGGYKLDLQGRFQSTLMATTGPDGKIKIEHTGQINEHNHK